MQWGLFKSSAFSDNCWAVISSGITILIVCSCPLQQLSPSWHATFLSCLDTSRWSCQFVKVHGLWSCVWCQCGSRETCDGMLPHGAREHGEALHVCRREHWWSWILHSKTSNLDCQHLPYTTHTTNSHRIKLSIFGRDYTENNYPSLNMKRHFKSFIYQSCIQSIENKLK